MTQELKLKEIERKAFRSTFQDGLWDVYLGLIVICMAVFMFRSDEGYGPWNLLLMVAGFGLSFLVFWAGKKFITVPRMGQVSFGPLRKQKKTTLAIIMGAVVLVQVGIVLFTVGGWLNADLAAKINSLLGEADLERMAVAAIGSLFIGPSMILVAYFNDFPRGYYIAILMAAAVFLMILLNQPVYAILIGALIILPGLVLFIRFLQKYPLPQQR
jgi:hypothetical protein